MTSVSVVSLFCCPQGAKGINVSLKCNCYKRLVKMQLFFLSQNCTRAIHKRCRRLLCNQTVMYIQPVSLLEVWTQVKFKIEMIAHRILLHPLNFSYGFIAKCGLKFFEGEIACFAGLRGHWGRPAHGTSCRPGRIVFTCIYHRRIFLLAIRACLI